jgi:hypothetical protein
MKIHTDCQIEEVASKDKTRKVLNHVFLRGDKLLATDGRALVEFPVELEQGDVDGYVTADALKAARKAGASIHANGSLSLSNGQAFPRPSVEEVGTYPNCVQVVQNADSKPVTLSIAFDVGLLKNLADAFGTEAVKLELCDTDSVIRVYPVATRGCAVPNEKARGILMPIRTA